MSLESLKYIKESLEKFHFSIILWSNDFSKGKQILKIESYIRYDPII